MSPLNNRHKLQRSQRGFVSSRTFGLLFAGLLLLLSLVTVLNYQYVLDTLHFWGYHPNAEISKISDRAAFTDKGKFIFYATRPATEESYTFNNNCARTEEGTAILGCYVNGQIHLFDVTDSRLDGIKEVTAAHEMLHAVYQRLSSDERNRINQLVEKEYEKIKSNEAFAERMAFYERTEPGERDNELHSIIATEFTDISPELEAHYAKYFKDRGAILKLFNGYNDVFNELDKEAKALSAQLDALSKSIDADMNKYNADVKKLNSDIVDFNQRAGSGKFSSQAAFAAERQSLQNRVSSVNALRTKLNADIDKYEALRKTYNETVKQSNNLYKSIDSTLAPAPSV